MKKKMLIAAAVALTACVVALAQSEVLSQNAVGYVKKSVPAAGGLAIVVHSLDSMDTANVIFTNTSIASEMPVGSTAYFWNQTPPGSWAFGQKNQKGANPPTWDGVAANKVLTAGESFFLKTPATQLVEVVVTIAGEVPADATIPVTVLASNNLTAVGNPYPVSMTFTNTDLASNAPVGSTAYFWNSTPPGSWGFGQKNQKGANPPTWDGVAATKTLEPGEGFFIRTSSNSPGLTWSEAKPYTWP